MAADYQASVFAGIKDLIETVGGRALRRAVQAPEWIAATIAEYQLSD